MPDDERYISVTVPPGLFARLHERAHTKGLPLKTVIVDALRVYLDPYSHNDPSSYRSRYRNRYRRKFGRRE